jgi:hypothetical protein
MKILSVLIVAISLIASSTLAEIINFDDAKPGEGPAGWICRSEVGV